MLHRNTETSCECLCAGVAIFQSRFDLRIFVRRIEIAQIPFYAFSTVGRHGKMVPF